MEPGSIIASVISGVIAWALTEAIALIIRNRRRLKMYGLTCIRRGEPLRISAAYLFRIKVNGKFLLIKGHRIRSQYQPVGGVYKSFSSAMSRFNELSVTPDDSLKSNTTDSDDLRVQLPRKNAIAFLDWFDSRTDREISTLREFREELVTPGYLGADAIEQFNPVFIRSCDRKLEYSTELHIHEILVHDVYEVSLSESNQSRIQSYVDGHPGGELVLVDKGDIDSGTFELNGEFFGIAPTAKKVL